MGPSITSTPKTRLQKIIWRCAFTTIIGFIAHVIVKNVLGTANGLNRRDSTFDVTVSQFSNKKLIPFYGGVPFPYGVNRGIMLYGIAKPGVTVINDIKKTGTTK